MAKDRKPIIDYLLEVYSEDPLVADTKVMEFLKTNYPKSKATLKTLALWKNYIREIGIGIPKKRK